MYTQQKIRSVSSCFSLFKCVVCVHENFNKYETLILTVLFYRWMNIYFLFFNVFLHINVINIKVFSMCFCIYSDIIIIDLVSNSKEEDEEQLTHCGQSILSYGYLNESNTNLGVDTYVLTIYLVDRVHNNIYKGQYHCNRSWNTNNSELLLGYYSLQLNPNLLYFLIWNEPS